jgi:hypothetical protein
MQLVLIDSKLVLEIVLICALFKLDNGKYKLLEK